MEIFWYIYNFRHFFFRCFSAIYGFYNIFVSFHPNIMIFGTFWREFKVLPKTGPNRGELVLQDWSFCSLSILKVKDQDRRSGLFRSGLGLGSVSRQDLQTLWKTRTAGPVFSSLFPVRSRSWIGLKTGPTNTSYSNAIAAALPHIGLSVDGGWKLMWT